MKKILLSSLMLFISVPSIACLGEAQIIAKVSLVSFTSATSCYIEIKATDLLHFAPSGVCPLDFSEVVSSKIAVPAIDQGQCSVVADDTVSGVVVKTADGRLVLE